MSNEKIRAVLAAAGANGLTPEELKDKAGAVPRGRPARDIELRDGRYYLVPDASPRMVKKRAKKKAPRRLKGHMAEKRARQTKSIKDIAKRPGISTLTLDNYVGATELLIKAIEQEVEGLDKNPLLSTALANHKRAEAMFNATRVS